MISSPGILASCGLAFIFSYILLIMFRYAIKYVIFTIFIAIIAVKAVLSGIFWTYYVISLNSNDTNEADQAPMFLTFAIVFTISTLIAMLILYLFRNKIKLVAQLFKEASKALMDIPLIMFEPILVRFCLQNMIYLKLNIVL
jgi:solute carrier family 44 protein 1 (choline transporter-like protein)